MDIKYLQHRDIDKKAWDKTITKAPNGKLYGYSWYLDVVCPNWDALISDDYSYIFPLTGKKKYGISYLFRPLLSQQLGLFSTSIINPDIVNEYLDAIPGKYRLIQYCLNKENILPSENQSILHKTFELDLSSKYEDLKSGYSDNHKRNLKKEKKLEGTITDYIGKEEFIQLLKADTSPGSRILKTKTNLSTLEKLLDAMLKNNACIIVGKRDGEEKLDSAVLFGISHKTWYYLVPVNSDAGREGRSLFGIIDFLIRSNSGQEGILDFEGSDIPGLAKFYNGFGAIEVLYPEININKLPWPIKYLK